MSPARRTASVPIESEGRAARRREETRSKLVRAARDVMGRNGVGATTIQAITDAADVGFGSFYNHFASKEDIVAAVMDEAVESFGAAADQLAGRLSDPAEILAASVRHVAHMRESALAGADVATIPTSVFKALLSHPLTDKGLAAFIADAKKAGVTIKG